jgi:hypothetical protein
MTYEVDSLGQATSRISLFVTNFFERKSMSTKTTFKRLALVTAVALGLGGLSTISAHAADEAVFVTTATTVNGVAVTTSNSTAFPALNATQISGISAPKGATIVLTVKSSGTPTVTAKVRYVSDTLGVLGTSAPFAAALGDSKTVTFTAPGAVGTYTGHFDYSVAGTFSGDQFTAGNFTITVTAGIELQNSTYVTAASHRVASVALSVTAPSGRIGTKVSVTPSYLAEAYTLAAGSGSPIVANVDAATLVYSLTKPTGSASALSAATQQITQTSAATNSATAATAVAAAASSTGTAVTFTPDVAGTYTLLAFHDANANGIQDAGEAYASKSVVISASAPVATLTVFGSTSTTTGEGALVRVALTNGGVAASMGTGDGFTITTTNTGAITEGNTITSVNSKGYAFIHVTDAAAEATTITLTGTGTLAGVTASTTVTFKTPATAAASTVTTASTTATWTTGGTTAVANGEKVFNNYLSAGSTGLTISNATDAVTKLTYTDGADGCITGLANGLWTVAITYDTTTHKASAPAYAIPAACTTTVPVKGTPVAEAAVVVNANASVQVLFYGAASGAKQAVVTPASLQAVKGSTLTYIATVKDQFGGVKTGVPVTVTDSASSRNYGSFVTQNLVTDANGQVSWSVVDAPLTANTGLTSDSFTVAVAPAYAVTNLQTTEGGTYTDASVTIAWVTAIAAASIGVGTDEYSASLGYAGTANPQAIPYGYTGAQAATRQITAVVKDANGALVAAGVPVTFSVAGTGAAILSTKVTAYTDATGTATSAIYGWLAGTYTVTASVGTVKGTATETFSQANPDSARVITATVAGPRVTAKVVDRFGNPVSGVIVYALATGTGYFGSGTGKTSDTTGADGSVYFVVTGGSATVTVSLVSFSAPAGSVFGQSSAAAGYDYDATVNTATAMTATTVGTALVAEKGVGASFAPAGVSSATVTITADTSSVDAAQAAQDAANEATDAANAATDAANNAMDSADAAQQAAMDAGDKADAALAAVTDLATKVSEIASQISSLSAVVAKIAAAVAKISAKVKA